MGYEGEAEILKIGLFCGAEVVRRWFDAGSTVVRQRWLFINGYEIERNSMFLLRKVKGYIQAAADKYSKNWGQIETHRLPWGGQPM